MSTTQKILNYFIEETDFGYALKGNREFSGITTIQIFTSKKEALLELKKLTKIKKIKKFDAIQLNQFVSFEENGMIETGVVCFVEHNKFTLRALRSYDYNGVITYYDKYFHFFKSGIKTNRFYTWGNAIEIIN